MGWVYFSMAAALFAAVWVFLMRLDRQREVSDEFGLTPSPSASLYRDDTESGEKIVERRENIFPAYTQQGNYEDRSEDATYSIFYADVDGVVTERGITVLETYLNGSAIYIRAECHLRESERTFRADRILECFDCRGNRIEDPEVHFAGTLPLADRPDPEHDSVMARVRPGLSALVWVAMADRDISTEEMEILLAYIADRNAIGGARFAAVQWDRAKATAQIDQMRPTLADALAAVARMSPTGKDFALQREYLAKLVAVGGAASERRAKQVIKQI